MDRAKYTETVAPFVRYHGQFRYVSHEDAKTILGEERFERMLKDRVRSQGPRPGTVYPWNVIDYLGFGEP